MHWNGSNEHACSLIMTSAYAYLEEEGVDFFKEGIDIHQN
jgi:hypothetical protein